METIQRSNVRVVIALIWVLPAMVFGYFSFVHPWRIAEEALSYLGTGPKVVVAMSFQGRLISSSPTDRRTQTYIAFPVSLRTLDAYEVVQEGERVQVVTARFGFLVVALFYSTWIGLSIWYLLFRVRGSASAQSEA